MEVYSTPRYGCIACGTSIPVSDSNHLHCSRCSQLYPVVSGIPILTHRPYALLRAYEQALRTADSRIQDLETERKGDQVPAPQQDYYLERVARALTGMRSNLSLIRTYMKPAATHLARASTKPSFIDAMSTCGAGWPADTMMGYFYVDWGTTRAFETVKSVMVATVRGHRADAESVAVLGAGACGLLNALAPEFDNAYGIDLSVPILLVARGVLRGDTIAVYLSVAGWRAVEVRAQELHGNIHLAVADAVQLPFEDCSLSVIVTQYIMDVVNNPQRVATEIERVLKPQGIWVNFSMPLRHSTEPPEFGLSTVEELPAFLRSAGLDLVEARNENFATLDFQKIDTNAYVCLSNVHVFTARKSIFNGPRMFFGENERHEDRETWWDKVPAFNKDFTAQVTRATCYGAKGSTQTSELSLSPGPYSFLDRFSLASDDAAILSGILDLIDGIRTTREIHNQLSLRGFAIATNDLRELFHYLSDRHGIVRIETP
jgi:SAM-dependent methyltransferase